MAKLIFHTRQVLYKSSKATSSSAGFFPKKTPFLFHVSESQLPSHLCGNLNQALPNTHSLEKLCLYINGSKTPIKKRSRSNLFRALFSRLNLWKTICSSSSSSSLSLSSWPSPSSSEIIPMAKLGRRGFWSSGSSFDFTGDDEEDDADSPTSTMCFSACRSASSDTGYRRSCK